MSASGRQGDLRLAPESIEELALRLAEVVAGVVGAGGAPGPLPDEDAEAITAQKVSEDWGVSRRWVYDHAKELGAHRLGSGKRPRLRFDPAVVAERLGEPAQPRRRPCGARRMAAIAGDSRTNSLSPRGRASVRRNISTGRGRRR